MGQHNRGHTEIALPGGTNRPTATCKNIGAWRNGADTVQSLSYDFDLSGNREERHDFNQNLTEEFVYDGLNRLTGSTLG